MNNLRERLLLIQKISGKTQAELASIFGVTFLAFNNWINEKSVPRQAKLAKINEYAKTLGLDFIVQTEKPELLFVEKLTKTKPTFINKIYSRADLIDELSLRITYNTNNIEGSTMTEDDTKNVIFHKKTLANRTLNEQLEAKNHDIAFRYILDYVKEKKEINVAFLKELHRILMAGILQNAGQYRNHSVRIVGSFVPTANYLKVENLVETLFKDYKKNSSLKDIFAFHSELEKVHPFSDGNGRVGRLVLISMLLENNFPPAIIKGKVKNNYYKALQNAQLKNEFGSLNTFLLDATIEGYKIVKE
jgi:Fic family protein